MNALAPRFELKQHKFLILGLLLCAYFLFHLFSGPRSLFYLQDVNARNEQFFKQLEVMKLKEGALEAKVVKLRPETLDPDFLEERARSMLGYMEEGEIMVVE